MIKYIVLVLAIAVIAAVTVGYGFYTMSQVEYVELKWSDLEELVLVANSLKEVKIPRAKVEVLHSSIEVKGYRIPITLVKLVYRIRGSYVWRLNSTWNLWCNGSCGGLVSFIRVVDKGTVLEVYYFNCSVSELDYLSYSEKELKFKWVFRNASLYSNGTKIYGFSGVREVKVIEVEVRG